MPVILSADLKNALILTARSLREGDELSALNHFRTVCTQNPEIANRVYGRLWEVMERPDRIDFGKAAFWNADGQTAPFPKKTKAIEDILKTLLDQSRIAPPPSPPLPPGAKPLNGFHFFFDCGFDPRFSTDGNYLLPVESISWEWLCKQIGQWAAYLEFTCRAYCSFDPEERKLRQMILSCAKIEKAWGDQTKHTFTEEYEGIYSVFALEHAFLNRTSQFYQMLHPASPPSTRLYPSEALQAIHSINKPQASYWRKELAAPGLENGDLSRCGIWGLWRLSKGRYDVYNQREKRHIRLDQHELRYVPHYIFIHAIEEPSCALKTAIREYRQELSSLITDQKCARSFASCKEKLLSKMHALHTAWDGYVNSHELLKEVNTVFSKQDHYKPLHDNELWETQMSHIPFFSTLYKTYNLHVHDAGAYWHDHYRDEGSSHLKQAIQRDFPNTLSARLLRAYDSCN